MIERSHAGARCRATRHIHTIQGILPRDSEGTIRYEMNNPGRHLIFVDWDSGLSIPVFPKEIEILVQEETRVPLLSPYGKRDNSRRGQGSSGFHQQLKKESSSCIH
jgi:hypothetical protein